jgi:hypothetical protein
MRYADQVWVLPYDKPGATLICANFRVRAGRCGIPMPCGMETDYADQHVDCVSTGYR